MLSTDETEWIFIAVCLIFAIMGWWIMSLWVLAELILFRIRIRLYEESTDSFIA